MKQSAVRDIFATHQSVRNVLPALVAQHSSSDVRRWNNSEDAAASTLDVQQLAYSLLSALMFGDEPLLHHICEKVQIRYWWERRSAEAFRKLVEDALKHPFLHYHLLGSLRTRRCRYIVEELLESLDRPSIDVRHP